jgi:hypothetical protein
MDESTSYWLYCTSVLSQAVRYVVPAHSCVCVCRSASTLSWDEAEEVVGLQTRQGWVSVLEQNARQSKASLQAADVGGHLQAARLIPVQQGQGCTLERLGPRPCPYFLSWSWSWSWSLSLVRRGWCGRRMIFQGLQPMVGPRNCCM